MIEWMQTQKMNTLWWWNVTKFWPTKDSDTCNKTQIRGELCSIPGEKKFITC